MKILTSATLLVTLFALSTAKIIHHGHYDGHGHGGHDAGHGGVAVHYSVVTEHKVDHHGHGGGHDGGHAAVHTWGQDEGHKGGDYGGHYGGHDHEGHAGDHGGHDDGHDHHAYPKYEFSYGVKDAKSGDIKSQTEHRDGGNVKGSYTVKEADGTTRHVEYSADKHKGFKAVVHTLGHAHGGHDGGHGHGGHGHGGHGHGGHGHGGHGHGGHGKASSYIVVKKQEEKKH